MTIVVSSDRTPANPALTAVGVLVDRSGSMVNHLDAMQAGLNGFLVNQAQSPGLLDITLAQFDDEYEVIWPLRRVRDQRLRDRYTLVPRGGTALFDAMGRFITDTRETLSASPIIKRPAKVIICIVTDGDDNSSVEWTEEMVKTLVDRQKAQGWEFIFLSADADAVSTAVRLGIPKDSAMTFDAAAARAGYAELDRRVSKARRAIGHHAHLR